MPAAVGDAVVRLESPAQPTNSLLVGDHLSSAVFVGVESTIYRHQKRDQTVIHLSVRPSFNSSLYIASSAA